jgi:hypothetical protein
MERATVRRSQNLVMNAIVMASLLQRDARECGATFLDQNLEVIRRELGEVMSYLRVEEAQYNDSEG